MQEVDEARAGYDANRIVERPDGYYWQATDGREYGPFASLAETIGDMELDDDESIEPPESLEEAESDIGIAGWIDADTGEPAEEARARIEEH